MSLGSAGPHSTPLPLIALQSAVLLPPSPTYNSKNILTPADINVKESPSPVGLVVIAFDESDLPRTLPLFFVSAQAASNRSPSSDPLNGDGVKEGWYTIAQPSLKYCVKASPINHLQKLCTYRSSCADDAFRLHLRIDGCHVGFNKLLTKEATSDSRLTWDGFKKNAFPSLAPGRIIQINSQFYFAEVSHSSQSITDSSDSNDSNGFGTIQLDIDVGKTVKASFTTPKPAKNRLDSQRNPNSLGERMISKGGLTSKTRSGRDKCEEVGFVQYSCSRTLPHLTTVIHVRWKSWLQSRKIVNDEGNACTHDEFIRLKSLQAPEKTQRTTSHSSDITVVPKNKDEAI